MKDDIGTTKFSQQSRERWRYDVTTKAGKQLTIDFEVQPFGYIKEIFREGSTLIWNREYKAGENVTQTWIQKIQE